MDVALIQLGRIGDMILATPAFKIIKDKYPDSNLTVIAGRRNAVIPMNNPNVDKVLVYDKAPLKIIKFIMELRKIKFDYYIDPKDHSSDEGRIIAFLAKAENKAGYSGQSPFNVKIDDQISNAGLHYIDRYIKPLQIMDIALPSKTPTPDLYETGNSMEYVEQFLIKKNITKYYVLNISASHDRKMWSNENWSNFINKNNFAYPVILSYDPNDADRVEDLLTRTDKLIEFKSRNFFDVISLVKNAGLLITPDTALVHIAAAFDVPLLGLFSGLDDFYAKFEPLSSTREIVRAEKGDAGVHSIPVQDVDESYVRIIARIE